MPELASIHPWDAMGADEDIMLIDATLLSTTAESLACIPSYRSWVHSQDLRPAYAYLLRLLKFLQWQKKQRGQQAQYWSLKTPMHLGYVEVIAEQMPERGVRADAPRPDRDHSLVRKLRAHAVGDGQRPARSRWRARASGRRPWRNT